MAVLQAGDPGATDRLIVVGAGVAGMRTAVVIRKLEFLGRITLMGTELHRTYDRPLLSKAVLGGEADDATIEVDWDGLDAELRLGETARLLYETGAGSSQGEPKSRHGMILAGEGPRSVTLSRQTHG